MKIRLGYKDADFKHPLHYRVRDRPDALRDAHICLCAPSSCCTFRDILVPMLLGLDSESSCIGSDPKAQPAAELPDEGEVSS